MDDLCHCCKKNKSKYTCSKCRVRRYCSPECQKKDWKRHKEECKSLALKKDLQWRNQMALSQPHSVGNHLKCYLASITKNIELRDSYDGRKELGRCMVAKHDFNVRDCIYSESSYACIPIHSSNYYACMKCLQLVSTPEFICPLCKTSYCSSECMKADAGTHKRFCHLFSMLKRILNTTTTSIPITATKSFVSLLTDESLWRLTLRILLRPEPTQADALGFEDMTNLCYTPLTDNCQESWVGPFLIAISQAIADLLSNATPLSLSADSIAALFTRLCHNVFSITSSRMLTNGYGLFLTSSFINHSCTPNAIASFVDDSIRIHAIVPIKKGDEITICYSKFGCDGIPGGLLGFECKCTSCQHIPLIEEQLEKSVRTGMGCLCAAARDHPYFKVHAYKCLNCLQSNTTGYVLRAPRSEGYICGCCQSVITRKSPYFEEYECAQRAEKKVTQITEQFARGEAVSTQDLLLMYMNPQLRKVIPDISHFWREILTICLSTDIGNSVFENQAFVTRISATVNSLSIAPIFTPSRLTLIMAVANKFYKIYKQNPNSVNSFCIHGLSNTLKAWNSVLVMFHFEDTCYGEAWCNLYQLVVPVLKAFNEDFCICFTTIPLG